MRLAFALPIRRVVALAACAGLLAGGMPSRVSSAPVTMQDAIQHVVVIYQENWSFDGLYGRFPGANGIANAAATTPQVDKVTGAPITTLPQPLVRGVPDPNFAFVAGKPVAPYLASDYVAPSQLTGDLVHKYYQQRAQIDGGKMDKFMTWSDNPGLVFSGFDATTMPEGRLASQYTLADNGFHSTFGSSFLNHMFLICACIPTFPHAPSSAIVSLDPSGQNLALDASGKIVHDGYVTPDGYAVNTTFSVNAPHPGAALPETLLPNQTSPTIGDRLTAANVTWKWYSGGWNSALAGNPEHNFQFHHQPFVYFANYADGTAAKAAHLQDETNFLADVRNSTLPSVSFIKPVGDENEHPGYATLVAGQQHVASLVQAVQNSPYWKNTAIIITYDENGGRWDHVPPPVIDKWGPGTRVPFIFVSPWAKHNFVDHTQYETASILAFIEKLYNVKPLGTRDAGANPFTNAFDFSQQPSARGGT